MEIIERLAELPINKGQYLVLPNKQNPTFIIPMTSKWVFRTAVVRIKPRNFLGKLKIIALSMTPFFILRRVFDTIQINTDQHKKDMGHLILPWNKNPTEKFTIFSLGKWETTILKVGFGKAMALVQNENKCIHIVKKLQGTDLVPQVISFTENNDCAILESKFYKGSHPNTLPDQLTIFLEGLSQGAESTTLNLHPYVSRIKIRVLAFFKEQENVMMIKSISYYFDKFKGVQVPIAIMHGDCSTTNVIQNKSGCCLIDWEESVIDGVPLDITYFTFRQRIDRKKHWQIKDAIDFLVMIHYFFFQISHGKGDEIRKYKLENGQLSIG